MRANQQPDLLYALEVILEIDERNTHSDFRAAVREIATYAVAKAHAGGNGNVG